MTHVKLANSVKINNDEKTYCIDENFHITLDGIIVTIVERKSGKRNCTSLMNAISFDFILDEPQTDKESVKPGSKR